MGVIQKVGKFLGIDKFGKAAASAGRVLTGQVDRDIEAQVQVDQGVQKLLYAANREKNPEKKKRLLSLLKTNAFTPSPTAEEIDPGLNLSNKEVLGSAANVALNVAMPGAFKGTKTAVVAKNAAQGAGFGAASGLEKGRSAGNIVGSAVGGALTGAAFGAAGQLAKAAKEFVSVTTPKWLMTKAVTPTLNELRKNVNTAPRRLGKNC